jgi:predicted  nucleic acid-binding Zn-ribbon protein
MVRVDKQEQRFREAEAEWVQRFEQLEAENKRLQDEVSRLDALIDRGLYAEIERLRGLLKRIGEWDMLDVAADGAYWRSEIDKCHA